MGGGRKGKNGMLGGLGGWRSNRSGGGRVRAHLHHAGARDRLLADEGHKDTVSMMKKNGWETAEDDALTR